MAGEPTFEDVSYDYQGAPLRGLLCKPAGADGRCPGVLLAPAAFGFTKHARDRAAMIAQLGYVVLVADHYGNGATYEVQEAMEAMGGLFADVAGWRGRLNAGLEALGARPEVDKTKLGAVGYCVGGTAVLELAYSGAPLSAVVSFHGGLTLSDPAAAAALTQSILVCTGADDPLVPPADVQEFERQMRSGKADWQIHVYGNTIHAFTDPDIDALGLPVARYNKQADERSWGAMRQLFEQVLGSVSAR
ncbi:MAG: dienelactone hydrolase family protein [Alphaproteobacteria bacterium]|nr:dienelactone hydrolase family protein [Alphaproteobacteria bacterium]